MVDDDDSDWAGIELDGLDSDSSVNHDSGKEQQNVVEISDVSEDEGPK